MHGYTPDSLTQPLIKTGDTEGIPLSETRSSLSRTIENPESKDHGQDSQDEIVSEPNLNVTDTELTAVTESPASHSSIQYQLLSDSDPYTVLYHFLNSVGIDRRDILQAGVSESHLLKLFQKETGWFSFLQWCSIDHIVEKTLQWPLLSPKDVSESAPESWFQRVRPHGRSILLKSTWGLMKAYAARGFAKGVETSLAKSVHYFIYAMLMYRLIGWLQIGQDNFVELKDLFQNSNQKGIDSLVVALAKLSAQWLRLILVSPLIIGTLQSMVSLVKAHEISSAKLKQITQDIADELTKPSRFCRDTMREMLPLLSQIISLSSKIQNLEQFVRWDGRLSVNDRCQSFECVRRAAKESHQMAQLNTLESLAKIVHGVGLKDLSRLHSADYFKAELLEILYAKTTALSDLEELSRAPNRSWKAKLTVTPRRVYATYLLWWLGLSTSFLKQRIPFFLFKAGKLTLEIFLLQQMVESILEAIRCPDKPGFKFGDGYQDWAADYTSKCFTTKISYFRTLDINESVDSLVAEIPQYYLKDLMILDLSLKYLTDEEAYKIIRALVQQGAPLQQLNLGFNQLSNLNYGLFTDLSQLQQLDLSVNQFSYLGAGAFTGLSQLLILTLQANQLSSLNTEVFIGLSRLQYLDLSYSQLVTSDGLFTTLNQLQTLYLSANQLDYLEDGLFSGLSQLQNLDLSLNQLRILNEGLFSDLNQLQTLSIANNVLGNLNSELFTNLTKLQYLDLSGNMLSMDNRLFASLNQLKILYLSSNQLNNLSSELFTTLSQLQYLDLSDNTLHMNGKPFAGLKQLQTLDLSNNQLIGLSDEIFSGLSQLQVLYLHDNLLNNLSSRIFANLSQLQKLNLNSNRINTTTLMDILPFLSQILVFLDISSNDLTSFPDDFSQRFPLSIQTLYIGNNSIIPSVLTPEFMRYFPSTLTYFSLERSNLTNIAEDSFLNFPLLQGLDLSNNKLSSLNEKEIIGLGQLQTLDLSYNQLSSLSSALFVSLSHLQTLFLDNNQLVGLNNRQFYSLSQLQQLSLSRNRLSSLYSELFVGLNQLQQLDLSDNQLSNLSSGLFADLNQLLILILSGNQLDDIAIKNMTSGFPYQVNTLNLYSNSISNIQPLVELLFCTNLDSISLDSNPINDTALAVETQRNILRKFCEDQRCHANLPASQSCSVPQGNIGLSKMVWGTGSSIKMIDEDRLPDMNSSITHYFSGFFASHSFTNSNLLTLPNPDSYLTKDSLATAGAMVVGVVGFSLLLYKNATIVRTVVNVGCQLLQNGFDRTRDCLKTATNFYSFYSPFKTKTGAVSSTGSRLTITPRVY